MTITCPVCGTAELILRVTSGSDQGGWRDIEVEFADCECDVDADQLLVAYEEAIADRDGGGDFVRYSDGSIG